jgi:hypothetical protein
MGNGAETANIVGIILSKKTCKMGEVEFFKRDQGLGMVPMQ